MVSFTIYSILLVFILVLGVVNSDKYCGTSQEDAESKCWQPCTTDEDCQACAIAYSCYETGSSCGSNNKEGTNHYYCGLSEFHQFECMQSTCGYHKFASYTFSLSLFIQPNFLSLFYFQVGVMPLTSVPSRVRMEESML